MDSLTNIPVSHFQKTCEKGFGLASLILLEFHMMHCPYRDVLANYGIFIDIERWLGLLLLVLVLLYLLIIVFKYPESLCRIRAFFRKLRSFEQGYMFYIFLWYFFTVFLRQILFASSSGANYFSSNDWWMFITGLMAFVMFPMARVLGSGNIKRIFKVMLKLILLPHLVFFSWALWQYLHLNEVVFPSGSVLKMTEYSMEIGVNRNTVGAYGVSMMVICLYLIVSEKSWQRFLFFYGVVIYSAVLILSNCRTSWYTALFSIIMFGILSTWNHFHDRHILIRLGSGVLIAAVGVFLFYWFRIGLFMLLHSAIVRFSAAEAVVSAAGLSSHALSFVPLASSRHFSSALPLATTIDDYLRTNESGLNGREAIYRAAIYLMFHSKYCFLFGVTPVDVGPYLSELFGIGKVFPSAHNFFLQMGVSYGVPCMLITIAFIISLIVRSVRLLFIQNECLPPGFWMIPIVSFSMLVQDMTEAYLNSGGTLACVFFYVFSGWIVAMDQEFMKKRIQNREIETDEHLRILGKR